MREQSSSTSLAQTPSLPEDLLRPIWSKDEIDPGEAISQTWWKEQSHRWQHYVATVPWMMFINGNNHAQFAGAWTILNESLANLISMQMSADAG
ncbi:hypothetical protein FIBSPDRAFT_945545 [Athelia psychrophila]|uniref:Uncharacterized protein n=1 Tax=Athelia psychrophila TaxID=1759441 RepID=A0A166TWJ7_9AGAM|nr:hypothetical protein FIBSPDRAFT_945545 [Fibularhizoctonia sp. CBS 109695]